MCQFQSQIFIFNLYLYNIKDYIINITMKGIITTKNRLKDYALWYYFRYFPSKNKLERKLLQKSDNNITFTKEVLSKMSSLINEEENIKSKIRLFLSRGKNLAYIRSKLYEKLFNKDEYEKIIFEDYLQENKSLLKDNFIKRKVIWYKKKGKSMFYIKQKLIERSEDKEKVLKHLTDIFPDWDSENIEILYNELSKRYSEKDIIKKLMTKWFNFYDIKKVIDS